MKKLHSLNCNAPFPFLCRLSLGLINQRPLLPPTIRTGTRRAVSAGALSLGVLISLALCVSIFVSTYFSTSIYATGNARAPSLAAMIMFLVCPPFSISVSVSVSIGIPGDLGHPLSCFCACTLRDLFGRRVCTISCSVLFFLLFLFPPPHTFLPLFLLILNFFLLQFPLFLLHNVLPLLLLIFFLSNIPFFSDTEANNRRSLRSTHEGRIFRPPEQIRMRQERLLLLNF
mmetsp:Transcript_33578/g.66539  ORF Transcript_33578/g.66539 Transcript_33578/m.66539 type:complete len:229 (-) Transcript_33578:381-1067(-)